MEYYSVARLPGDYKNVKTVDPYYIDPEVFGDLPFEMSKCVWGNVEVYDDESDIYVDYKYYGILATEVDSQMGTLRTIPMYLCQYEIPNTSVISKILLDTVPRPRIPGIRRDDWDISFISDPIYLGKVVDEILDAHPHTHANYRAVNSSSRDSASYFVMSISNIKLNPKLKFGIKLHPSDFWFSTINSDLGIKFSQVTDVLKLLSGLCDSPLLPIIKDLHEQECPAKNISKWLGLLLRCRPLSECQYDFDIDDTFKKFRTAIRKDKNSKAKYKVSSSISYSRRKDKWQIFNHVKIPVSNVKTFLKIAGELEEARDTMAGHILCFL